MSYRIIYEVIEDIEKAVPAAEAPIQRGDFGPG